MPVESKMITGDEKIVELALPERDVRRVPAAARTVDLGSAPQSGAYFVTLVFGFPLAPLEGAARGELKRKRDDLEREFAERRAARSRAGHG